MEYEDRLTIATPEGVELSMLLAGAPSRFVSAIVDLAIQATLLVVGAIVVGVVGGAAVAWAIYAIFSFLVVFGYDVFFEVLNAGRTPGKQMNGLRVVRIGGHPVSFFTSATRNLLRVVDFLPSAYLVGAITILVSSKNQRLGDIVAGTVVVRQRVGKDVPLPHPVAAAGLPIDSPYRSWDTSRISAEELAALVQFLDRRNSIDWAARNSLSQTLAARLRPKVTGAPPEIDPERLLEAIVLIRRTLGS